MQMFEATIRPVQARSSTIPEIEITFDIKNTENKDIILIGYALDVSLGGVTIGNVSDYIAYNISARGRTRFNQTFAIPPYVFNAIEKSRRNGDLHLSANMKALYIDPDFPNPLADQLSTASHKFSQSEWIKIISDLGYTKYKIFEIPYPDTPQLPEFEKIVKELEEAQTLFYEGKNDLVVSKCRIVLEQLRAILRDKEKRAKIDAKIDEQCIGEEGRDPKSKRVNDIFTKAYNFHNVGPHYHYFVAREDAEMSLILCMTLLRYYGVQLDKVTRDSKY